MANKKPVSFLQTDVKWKNLPYRVDGETATIGGSGCGPTCAAMVISTLTNLYKTPVDTCAWSVEHGYKALNQGTYYSYFAPQLAAYGIACKQLLPSRIIHQPQHEVHDKVKKYIQEGYWAIALMGPGLWTRSGHFVLIWDWDDKVRINDPASKRVERLNGDEQQFREEVRNYWLIDARSFNEVKEKFKMSENLDTSCVNTGDECSEWAKEATDYCKQKGIFNGDGQGNYGWLKPITREAVAQVIYNTLEAAGLLKKLPDA